jgi:hypothetical protein
MTLRMLIEKDMEKSRKPLHSAPTTEPGSGAFIRGLRGAAECPLFLACMAPGPSAGLLCRHPAPRTPGKVDAEGAFRISGLDATEGQHASTPTPSQVARGPPLRLRRLAPGDMPDASYCWPHRGCRGRNSIVDSEEMPFLSCLSQSIFRACWSAVGVRRLPQGSLNIKRPSIRPGGVARGKSNKL